MTQAVRQFIDGLSYYVPAMQAGGDLGQALNGRFSLGTPPVADADGILDGTDIATAGSTTTFNTLYASSKMGNFGRNVTVVASGTATSTVTVSGRDYLGQHMSEVLTLNGTTSVVGVKCFKYIDSVAWAGTASRTIDLGWGTAFGLPYVCQKVNTEFADRVAAAAGTLTAPVFTDPQTTTTGDPRGRYVPTTTPDGSVEIEVDCEFTNYVNASNNGGLHGIAHVNA